LYSIRLPDDALAMMEDATSYRRNKSTNFDKTSSTCKIVAFSCFLVSTSLYSFDLYAHSFG
jgi:hypothetical protein